LGVEADGEMLKLRNMAVLRISFRTPVIELIEQSARNQQEFKKHSEDAYCVLELA
jgi:hypothetical protein